MLLTRLRYFQAVCRSGSYTKAASFLCVSQPAISVAIKALEDEFGVKLFSRDGKIIHLTPEGLLFLGMVNDLLQHVDTVTETMQDIANQQKRIRLGMTPMLAMAILPKLYRAFHKAHPEIVLNVTEAPRSVLQQKLRRNQLDLIIVNANDSLNKEPAFQKWPVKEFQYCFCISEKHRFARWDSITIPQIGDTPLICFGLEYDQPSFLEHTFSPYQVTPNIMYHANSVSTIVEMISHNDFGGFMYWELHKKWPELKFIPLYPALTATPTFYWSKNAVNQNNIKKLIKCMKTVDLLSD